MDIAKKDPTAAGSLDVCASQDLVAVVAIHAIYCLFQEDETEAGLLADAGNASSSINRKATLHNISITCPMLSTFVSKCYLVSDFYFRKQGNQIYRRNNTR